MHINPAAAIVALALVTSSFAQEALYDELRLPEFALPDPLLSSNGRPLSGADRWRLERRPEILGLFEREVYGRSPGRPPGMRFEATSRSERALDGVAVRKEVRVLFGAGPDAPYMDILIYLPAGAQGPRPVFLGLNFSGNHSVQPDPEIPLSTRWMRPNARAGVVDNRATEASRGTSASRWPVSQVVARGYGVATIYCGDIDPDFHDGFANGVHPLFYEPGRTAPRADEWGTIGAWAWGLSRALDYFETDPEIDHERVAVLGHSRLGKTALWAGAQDERFAIVISNNSGCGGAALSRRRYGESVARINSSFPHWFCDNFKRYGGNEGALPVDQHMLIALIAPRPVYVASATDDRWADPQGEFLSLLYAEPVYRMLGAGGLGVAEQPAPDTPVGDRLGYHLRSGPHDITLWDWERYMDFADRHMGR